MVSGRLKEPREVLLFFRPPIDTEEVDYLDKQPRVAFTCPTHTINQLTQARNKSIVPNSKQRAAGDIADAGCLHDNCTRAAGRETAIPINDVGGYKAIFCSAPGNHCRYPGAAGKCNAADLNRAEQNGTLGFGGSRPASIRNMVADWVFGMPHNRG